MIGQLLAQRVKPISQPRFDRADGHAHHFGDFGQRHLVLVMQHDDGAAGGRYLRGHLFDRFWRYLIARWRGQVNQDRFVFGFVRPSPFAFQLFERFACGDAISPRAEQFRLAQPANLAIDEDEDLLQDVLGQRARSR